MDSLETLIVSVTSLLTTTLQQQRTLAGLSVSILMAQVDLDNSGIPPGINNTRSLEYYASGGDENAWLNFSKKRYYTNAFIVEDGKVWLYFYSRSNLKLKEELFICFQKILLGLKKRGMGMNK